MKNYKFCVFNHDQKLLTCGMMFSLNSSINSGGGGKSQVKYKKGDSVITSWYSAVANRVFFSFSLRSVEGIFLVYIFIFPKKDLCIIELSLFFVPFNALCRALMNQERKSIGSPEIYILMKKQIVPHFFMNGILLSVKLNTVFERIVDRYL